MAKFYLTSAIPYVNAQPHIGHALEFIQGDTIARFHKVLGDDTLYLCGSDENAIKNVQAAEKEGLELQAFIDIHAKEFEDLAKKLHVQFDIFQKGSSQDHYAASQKLWELCEKNGDIYKKSYTGLYCVGCEEFKTKNDLNERGECPEHPGKPLEEVQEENYFFKLSNYHEQLLDLFESGTYEIIPQFRKNEILSFIKSGLQDFSISRSNERAKNWGVPVPNDSTQRIYVWFDALNIYQSGIGFGADERSDGARVQGEAEDKRGSVRNKKPQFTEKDYEYWWPADTHVIGKGIIRFHAVYWPAILLSAGLNLPKKLFVHEYFTVNGQKMSKTIGNVYDPVPLVEKYGADPLRYYCLAKISPFQDGDFSEEKFIESYNADLANGLGNLVARVAKLLELKSFTPTCEIPKEFSYQTKHHLETFEFNIALGGIWESIRGLDTIINKEKPWEWDDKSLTDVQKAIFISLVTGILQIAYDLQPFLPETAQKILTQFSGEIKSQSPLFPRIS